MALGSTQPLTEVSTKSISWGGGKGGRCVGLTTLPPSCAESLEILGASASWGPKGLYRDCLTLHSSHRLQVLLSNFAEKKYTVQIGTELDKPNG
jgi:hypothetical protein